MFDIGEEIRIITTGEIGAVINKMKCKDCNDYLISCEGRIDHWYREIQLELATISKVETTDYSIKSDQDKPQLRLVPISELWTAIARVREHGVSKYGDNDSWKKVELKRYHDALLRHTTAITQDLNAVDKESGLPHRWHIACNLAFIEYLAGDANV